MIGFFIGVVLTGITLSVVFGSLILEVEEKAYRKGRNDEKNRNKISESTDWQHGSDV